jgi:hypothetical protein
MSIQGEIKEKYIPETLSKACWIFLFFIEQAK